MGIESQDPTPPPGNLTPKQVKSFTRAEPKTLGAIQIIIGVLTLCLCASVLQIYEVHFIADIIVLLVIVTQLILSGSVLIHAGRRPSLFWVKATLVLHLVSAAFTTAALGLLSRHLPYRQDSYHCEHCRRMEIYTVQQHCYKKCTYTVERNCKLLIDGLLGTLVLFLVVELIICITAMLFGLKVLAKGGLQIRSVTQRVTSPQARPPPVTPTQVAVVVTEAEPELIEDIDPPTEPQVEPIEYAQP